MKCDINPCENNGECNQDSMGILSCKCPEGFDGVSCEYRSLAEKKSNTVSNPCVNVNCNNRGSCHAQTANSYICLCNG